MSLSQLGRAFAVQKAVMREEGIITLGPWVYGINTYLPDNKIEKGEMPECVNLAISRMGKLSTRPGIEQYSNTAVTGKVICFKKALVGSTSYELLVNDSGNLYYLDSSLDPQLIGQLESTEVYIVPFNGVAMLFDGSYVKYIDDTTGVKLCYDDGTGNAGYQFDNSAGTQDGVIHLGDGTNTRVAYKFTTQAWTTGKTIPPTSMSVMLSKSGTPSATAVVGKIRRVSDDAEMATATIVTSASADLTATPTAYTASFTVTTELDPSTAYYLTVEHTGGSSGNCVEVEYSTVSSGGHASIYTTAWTDDTTKDPVMYVKPGRPPKLDFGIVHDGRMFARDASSNGWLRYSAGTHLDWSTPTMAGYIGVIDDDANNFPIGALGSLYGQLIVYGTQDQPYVAVLEGDTPSNYSLPASKLRRVWSAQKSLQGTMTDLWAASDDGVSSLVGVQEYGDYRAFSMSDPVFDRFESYYDKDTAITGYYPQDAQFWLYMPQYHRVLVARTKFPVPFPDGGLRYPWVEYELYRATLSDNILYRWVESAHGSGEYYLADAQVLFGTETPSDGVLGDEGGGVLGTDQKTVPSAIPSEPDFVTVNNEVYERGTAGSLSAGQWDYADNDSLGSSTIYIVLDTDGTNPADTDDLILALMAPQCFETHDSTLFFGGSDGYVYVMRQSETYDLSISKINTFFSAPYWISPLHYVNITQVQPILSGVAGVNADLIVYTNESEYRYSVSWEIDKAMSDNLTLGEATMLLKDATFLLGAQDSSPWAQPNFNCRSFRLSIRNLFSTKKLYIDSFLIKYRNLRLI